MMADVENITSGDTDDQAPQALSRSSSDAGSVENTITSEQIGSGSDAPTSTTRPDLSMGSTARSGHSSSLIITLPAETSPQQQGRRRRLTRRNGWCRRTCLILTYPSMVVLSIVGLIVVLIFCVFPTLLFMGMVICAYYCCNPNPLPLSVLLRYLLAGEDPSRGEAVFFQNSSSNGMQDPEKVKADRICYQSQLIVRRLSGVETVNPSSTPTPSSTSQVSKGNDNGRNLKVIDHRSSTPKPKLEAESDADHTDGAWERLKDKIDLREHKYPIEIWTDHRILRFSAPLEIPTKDDDDDDDEKGVKQKSKSAKENLSSSGGEGDDLEYVPHNRRSSEMELSSGHLREPSPPSRRPGSRSSEYSQTSSGDGVRLPGDIEASQSDPSVCSGNDELEDATIKLNSQEHSINGEHDESSTDSTTLNSGSVGNPNRDYFGIEDDARDPGTACDICILEFEVGDEVAWSPNIRCSHPFHKDCILDWLVRNPTCPNCRQDYVRVPQEETV